MKEKLAHAIFPYSTSISALSKTIVHREENLAHASIPFSKKENTTTCPFPTTMLHPKGKHKNKCITNNYIVS
jgi:hypothetical protein